MEQRVERRSLRRRKHRRRLVENERRAPRGRRRARSRGAGDRPSPMPSTRASQAIATPTSRAARAARASAAARSRRPKGRHGSATEHEVLERRERSDERKAAAAPSRHPASTPRGPTPGQAACRRSGRCRRPAPGHPPPSAGACSCRRRFPRRLRGSARVRTRSTRRGRRAPARSACRRSRDAASVSRRCVAPPALPRRREERRPSGADRGDASWPATSTTPGQRAPRAARRREDGLAERRVVEAGGGRDLRQERRRRHSRERVHLEDVLVLALGHEQVDAAGAGARQRARRALGEVHHAAQPRRREARRARCTRSCPPCTSRRSRRGRPWGRPRSRRGRGRRGCRRGPRWPSRSARPARARRTRGRARWPPCSSPRFPALARPTDEPSRARLHDGREAEAPVHLLEVVEVSRASPRSTAASARCAGGTSPWP